MGVHDCLRDVTSFRPLCCECSRSIWKARSASIACRAIEIPFACSIEARRFTAWPLKADQGHHVQKSER